MQTTMQALRALQAITKDGKTLVTAPLGGATPIVFSRLGQPHVGSPKAFSFNVASISGAGAVTFERGGKTVKERRNFNITGGMCPRCEGRGTVTDFDLSALYDDSLSLNEGALTIPG